MQPGPAGTGDEREHLRSVERTGETMKARHYSRKEADQRRLCAFCGAPFASGRDPNYGQSLSTLLSRDTGGGANVCPACRQRDVSRRISAFVSTRM